MAGEVIINFDEVSFEYGHNKPILKEVSFTVRRGAKVTIMGQNGAGKSTIFNLITAAGPERVEGGFKPESGKIHINKDCSIALSRQVIPRDEMDLTAREFFEKCFPKKVYDIDPKIDDILEVVNLHAPHDRIIKSFSGGQQARLLLASALIQNPDILLLDEPTNNLDKAGISHLTEFLINYQKTCLVISHDAEFLNAFTEGVLYLDSHIKIVEQYAGNYFDVIKEIAARVEREIRKNAQMEKIIQEKKDKSNVFAHKGGGLRLVAKRMREAAAEAEENMVEVRKEDKTIRPFTIPCQEGLSGEVVKITSFSRLKDHKPTTHKAHISLRKNQHLLLKGPNGIGKSTLLESMAKGTAKGVTIAPGIKIGYYRQDFSTLNFEDTVYKALDDVMKVKDDERLRSVAAGFLITKDVVYSKIGTLSEGQKGLVAFAQLLLLEPGILILDEPTNHINSRHLPIIAKALDEYAGAMIFVSHVPDFVSQIRIDETLDLER